MRKRTLLFACTFFMFALLCSGSAHLGVSAQDQPAQTYSDDFSTDSGNWQYLGAAYRDPTNQQIVLSTAAVDQTGIAVFRAPIQGSFAANFSYKSGGGSSGLTNDGIVMFFYKQTYPSTINFPESYGANGIAGGRLGFNTGSIIPGYGIEFDGWQNIASEFNNIIGGHPNPAGDPSSSHIALLQDFTGDHLAYINDQRVADNVWHQVSVQVQGTSVTVYVDQVLALQWNGPLNRTYGGFGFTGSNGQIGGNWHIIDNFSITTQDLQQPVLGLSADSSVSDSSFRVKINGNLAANGTGVSDAPIYLSYSISGGQTWQDLTYIYTDPEGNYSATWLPSVTGNYMLKALYQGDAEHLGATSTINFAMEACEQQTVFSVNSNSTLSALSFNSTSNALSFGVSGPSGTTGYVNVHIPKSLISDASSITVYLDDTPTACEVQSQGDSWLLSFVYHHSSHLVTISLGTYASAPLGTVSDNITSEALLAGLIATVAVVGMLVYFRKRRQPKQQDG